MAELEFRRRSPSNASNLADPSGFHPITILGEREMANSGFVLRKNGRCREEESRDHFVFPFMTSFERSA